MDEIFVDTDVILDLILERDPFYQNAMKIFNEAELRKCIIHISALSVSNVYYFIRKRYSHKVSVGILKNLEKLSSIIEVNSVIIRQAFDSAFGDFEDAMQHYAALSNPKIKYLITRNISDYKSSSIPVLSSRVYALTFFN